ncbi:sensor domain-containing diguanylate cyclase [Sutcliffiella halmapala]|uniref:sensor domain-containing diguanylate cyclase n=1 Tax=Sutcliffiella halmapala TaxID=79882 RepID=UPI000995B864|nr:diguanylate cyclase [Sutcliffiella halmapala]
MKSSLIWLVLFILIFTNGVQYYSNLKLEAGTQALNQKLYPALRASDHVLTGLISQQTGIRGYSITSDTTFLNAYYEGGNIVSKNSGTIKEIMQDYPELQELYDFKVKPIQNRLQEMFQLEEYTQFNSREYWYRNKMYMDDYQDEHDRWILAVEQKMRDVSFQNDFYRDLSKYMFIFSLFVLLLSIMIFLRFYKLIKVKFRQLKKLANLDALTGIGNRRLFQETIKKMRKSGTPFQLILIDIDKFKQYNDAYGHRAGDACLKKVSDVIKSNTNKYGYYSRIGGEEFAIVLPQISLQESLRIAEELRRNIEALGIPHKGSPYKKVTISLGVASISSLKNTRFEDYYEQADQALYLSKERGRNQVSAHDVDSAV